MDEMGFFVSKWDAIQVKFILDSVVKLILDDKVGWSETHRVMNTRLTIASIACMFSAIACTYDYYQPFPQSRRVLTVCVIMYFICIGILQVFEWFFANDSIYEAIETDGRQTREWSWSSKMDKDTYTISAEFKKDGRSKHATTTKSIGAFIDHDGEVLEMLLEKEVNGLYARLIQNEE